MEDIECGDIKNCHEVTPLFTIFMLFHPLMDDSTKYSNKKKECKTLSRLYLALSIIIFFNFSGMELFQFAIQPQVTLCAQTMVGMGERGGSHTRMLHLKKEL